MTQGSLQWKHSHANPSLQPQQGAKHAQDCTYRPLSPPASCLLSSSSKLLILLSSPFLTHCKSKCQEPSTPGLPGKLIYVCPTLASLLGGRNASPMLSPQPILIYHGWIPHISSQHLSFLPLNLLPVGFTLRFSQIFNVFPLIYHPIKHGQGCPLFKKGRYSFSLWSPLWKITFHPLFPFIASSLEELFP